MGGAAKYFSTHGTALNELKALFNTFLGNSNMAGLANGRLSKWGPRAPGTPWALWGAQGPYFPLGMGPLGP